MKNIHELSIDELRLIKSVARGYDSVDDLIEAIENRIRYIYSSDLENVPLNVKFDLDMFEEYNIFTKTELELLNANGVKNLQDLIDLNLDVGDTCKFLTSFKEKIKWVRKFYNMQNLENNEDKFVQNKKKL